MRWCAPFAGMAALASLAGAPLQAKDDPVILVPNERLLVLPLEFYSFGGSEVAAEKANLGRRNLDSSLHRALQREQSLQFIELPDLSDDEAATVREYTDLMRTMAVSAVYGLTYKTVPWRDTKTWRIDYGIGDGLAFLAERAGVGKAIFVSGSRLEPTTTNPFDPSASFMLGVSTGPINSRIFNAMVIDLRSGDVIAIYSPARGLEGEVHTVAGANTWMRALFDDIPGRVRSEPPYNQPPPRKHERHVRSIAGFAIVPPKGWRPNILGTSCFRRHDWLLEKICVDPYRIDNALREKGLTSIADPMELGVFAMDLLKADPFYKDMEVASLTNARVGGRDGFRAELTSRLNIANSQRRERHLVYGVTGPSGAYLLRFDAPAIYYFEHHLAEFEAAVATFELL